MDINENQLSSIPDLSTLTNLEILNLDENEISSITALSSRTSLVALSLNENQISSISDLASLISLERLSLNDNSITDISDLASLTSLKRLSLNDNSISSISALSSLTSLTHLYLDGNTITDISALSSLTSLKTLRITGSNICYETYASVLSGLSLTSLDLNGDGVDDRSNLQQRMKSCPIEEVNTNPTPQIENQGIPTGAGLSVSFKNYPGTRITDKFVRIGFPEPVSGFQMEDIRIETKLTSGTRNATLEELTPKREPAQTYMARIELPPRAAGTVRLTIKAMAATNMSGELGPAVDIPSELIPFNTNRRVPGSPSYVAMDKVVFNEFRNAADDTNDWIELENISDKDVPLKDWEISLVASEGEHINEDVDIVRFPDYTLPAGGTLLIVNTDPGKTELIRGQDIENPSHNPALFPQYLIAPEMKLPSTPYLLILRSALDQNGTWVGFEDLAGDYYKGDVEFRTQIWPLRNTWVYTGTEARFSEGEVWQRVDTGARGYTHHAWALSAYHSGLGYRPGASPETSLGTPGYALPVSSNERGTGQISVSEVMFATDEKGSPSEWIELYNNSPTESVDLKGWRLVLEGRDSPTVYHYTKLTFKPLEVLPNQTVLLVARDHRNSANIPERRIYNVYRWHGKTLRIGTIAHKILGSEGFAVRLLSPDGTLVDMAGNLNGRQGRDKPRWQLPDGWTTAGARSSLIRVYEDRVPAQGTIPSSWVRAADTALLKGYSYWGLPTDNATPGYRQGSPLPVTLSSFRADLKNGAIVVRWTTESEIENAGFYVLRSQHRDSGFSRVSPSLIAGAGTTAERHTYTYPDTTARSNVAYYYQIEEVSLSGERRVLATVRLRGHLSGIGKLLRKWADVKSED